MSKLIDITPHLFPSAFDPNFTLDVSLSHIPDHFDKSGSILYKFSNFPNHQERPQLMFWMIQAFKAWAAGKEGGSRRNMFQNLKGFFIFIQDTNQHVYCPSDINPTVMDNYEGWLKAEAKREKSTSKHKNRWKSLNLMISIIRERRPEILHQETVPRKMSQRNSGGSETQVFKEPKKVLSKAQFAKIEAVCREKVDSYRIRWLHGKSLIEDAVSRGLDGKIVPDASDNDLGAVLLYLKTQWLITGTRKLNQFGGKIQLAERRQYQKLFGLNSLLDYHRYIMPTHEDLMPYIVLTLSRTGGNLSPILNLSRDCLSIPQGATDIQRKEAAFFEAVDGNRTQMWFFKSKTKKFQTRSYDSTSKYAPTTLISQVLEMTETTHQKAKGPTRNKLWVFYGHQDGVTWSRKSCFTYMLNSLIKSSNLDVFTARQFRDTLLNDAVAVTGNILGGQSLAGHSSPDTMIDNYLAGPGRANQHEMIAKIQVSMQAWVEKGVLPRTTDFGTLSTTSGAAIEAVVRAWIAAFTNTKLIVGGYTERAVRLLQMKEHLVVARPRLHSARWETGFSQLLDLVNELLDKFDPSVLQSAETVVRMPGATIPLPPIE